MTDCKKKYINIIRGDSTGWNGINFFKIHIDSRIDLYGFNAKFILGGNTFTFNNLYQDLEVELTSQQTQSLPLGVNYGTLYIFDESKKRKTITTSIPFNVKEWVDGDIAVDDYTFSVNITEGDETILSLNVETAVSVEVGTTTTLPAGSEATVTNSGTQNHLVLDFGIPEGEKGEKGETGEDGQDATINGVTALSIITDDGISSNMSGNTFVISGTEILDSISAEASTRENQIASIVEKIPEQASSTNKLADKDFVISSLQTFSAHFRGSWATWANVPTNPQDYPPDDDGNRTPTIHDYLIIVADEKHSGSTWRYTYTGEWQVSGKSGWKAEYEIKDTPFTSEQLAAINSGATRENISQISTLQTTKQDRLSTQQLQNIANVPNKMEVTDIIAGDNITVQVSGRSVKINSTGGGSGGASSFSELNGSPYDNTALANALNSKADESEIDEINQEIATISQSLANKAEVSDLNQTNENLSALTGDVENVSAEVMAQGEAIQNLDADKADKSTTYTKTETNNLLDAKANQSDLNTTTEIAKGAQKGVSFTNYYNAVQNINTYDYDKYVIGQSVYIVTKEVPDLWVSAKYADSVPYVYTSDDEIVEALKTSGIIRFGRYQLSPLETGKIDLSEYAKTSDLAQYIKKDGDETHNGKLTNTGVVDISSGVGAGALILGADVGATTRTSGVRKLARINAPTNESNLDISTTILSFDTQGDSASTIGQTGTGIYNRIEFGGRLGATTVTAPDGIAFTVAKTHNGMQQNQKVYALEMSSSQARFNVQPNYNGASLATINDIKIKGVQQNGVDLVPDSSGKVNVQATLITVIDDD